MIFLPSNANVHFLILLPCLFTRLLPNRPGQHGERNKGDRCNCIESMKAFRRPNKFASLSTFIKRRADVTDMDGVQVQFQLEREVRSACIESEDLLTFEALRRLSERTFATCKYPFVAFIYVDDDGDRVTVSSEREMKPLRAFYARLCQGHLSSKPTLQLETIVNRNHANLTIDPAVVVAPLVDRVAEILSLGTMLSLDMLEIIGRGNGGIVRRCRDRRTQEILAVKIISLDFENDEKKHEIVAELNALNSLKSDFIVRLHGACLHENSVYICTEFMDRSSLEQYVGLVVPEPVLIHTMLAMIHGLLFMWSRKIMHRDVKPSNVLVNSSGAIKLCDFGVSRVLETIGQKLATFIGTYRYMAPERIVSDDYRISSEIWSLAMTILEIGLGRYPFSTAREHSPIAVRHLQLIECIVHEVPPALPSDRHYSAEFATLIEQCLAKDPARRPLPSNFLENPLLAKYETTSRDQRREIIADFFNRMAIELSPNDSW